jgi:peptidoglycan-associated lipoprotein
MKKNLLYIPVVVLILSSCSGLYLNKGNDKFEIEAYAVAAEYYEKSYDKNKADEAVLKAVDSYLAYSNYHAAEKWLKKAISIDGASPIYSLKLAQVLVMNSKCEEGEALYQKYLELNPVAKESGRLIGSCDVPMPYNPDSTVYVLNAASVNTKQSNFGATFYKEGIVFTSQRFNERTKLEGKTNMPYMDLYYSAIDENGELSAPKSISDLNAKYHQGPATFSPDGNLVVYAASGLKKSGALDTKENTNVITLMMAENVNGTWSNIRKVFEGNPNYSMSHPALAADGETLYFSSDKLGMGGIDIYKTVLIDGKWSEPTAVSEVNTAGDDEFPYLWTGENESRLFFASNGIEGTLGGLDIYYMIIKGATMDGPYHMTSPVNSSRDDFNFVLAKDGRTGFLSSNRHEGTGIDYLYRVNLVDPEFIVECLVIDELSTEPLANATLVVLDKVTGEPITYNTDSEGIVTYTANQNTSYDLTSSVEKYVEENASVTTAGRMLSATIKRTIPMETILARRISEWEDIYYDYNRSTIRKESKIVMDTIAAIMTRHPEVRIELNGYADVRGDFMYNIELSKMRADKAMKYLIKKGIVKDRIVSQGMGETNILNKCVESVECTDEEHQINRRTEFRAIK